MINIANSPGNNSYSKNNSVLIFLVIASLTRKEERTYFW